MEGGGYFKRCSLQSLARRRHSIEGSSEMKGAAVNLGSSPGSVTSVTGENPVIVPNVSLWLGCATVNKSALEIKLNNIL